MIINVSPSQDLCGVCVAGSKGCNGAMQLQGEKKNEADNCWFIAFCKLLIIIIC